MQIINTKPTEVYDICRAVSENNRWEVGMRTMLYGVRIGRPDTMRICGGLVDSHTYTFDYCAGSDRFFAVTLLAIMHIIMQELPEIINESYLRKILPKEGVRPNTIDSECTRELLKLAQELKDYTALYTSAQK